MLKSFSLRTVFAWLLAVPAAYLFCAFWGNHYAGFISIFFAGITAHVALGLFAALILKKARETHRWNFILALILFSALILFDVKMFLTAQKFPLLFNASYFLIEKNQTAPFFLSALIALPALAYAKQALIKNQIQRTRLYQALDENAAGILVAGLFFAFYINYAVIFNQPIFDVDDIFFDTDGLLWRRRFATPDYQDYYWRSVHPFVLLILRPLVAIGAFFLNGNKLSAAFVLTALAGALCVFLVWYFIRRAVGNSLYALLLAALFGASAGQLVFGFLLETYISSHW